MSSGCAPGWRESGGVLRGIFVRASATLDQLRIPSPELGRSPFWERPRRALLDPEDLSGESVSRRPGSRLSTTQLVQDREPLVGNCWPFSRVSYSPIHRWPRLDGSMASLAKGDGQWMRLGRIYQQVARHGKGRTCFFCVMPFRGVCRSRTWQAS
jgi:hypothetical protein